MAPVSELKFTFVMQLSDELYEAALAPEGRPADSLSGPVSHINIGAGEDITIRELSDCIRGIVGFEGGVSWDDKKPDGMPRKLLDVSRLRRLGWQAKIGLDSGIRSTYQWYLGQHR